MNKQWDVLCLGCAAVDDLLYVPAYPPADTKTRVTKNDRQCGGLGATALVTAARLGCRCAYGAVLGNDELSRFVEDALRREGIDTAHVVRLPEARPGHSVIVIGQEHHTRNVFSISGRTGADENLPGEDVIRATRVLFLDHHGIPGGIRAAQAARQAGVAVVADLERKASQFADLLELVDHLILSVGFARTITGASNPAEAVGKLWTPARQAVVVTCGSEGAWYTDKNEPGTVLHQPAFRVEVVDTTGCGDVFHGAYAAALAQGLGMAQRVRYAGATAALKATRPGGQRGIPDRAAVEKFLREYDNLLVEPQGMSKGV